MVIKPFTRRRIVELINMGWSPLSIVKIIAKVTGIGEKSIANDVGNRLQDDRFITCNVVNATHTTCGLRNNVNADLDNVLSLFSVIEYKDSYLGRVVSVIKYIHMFYKHDTSKTPSDLVPLLLDVEKIDDMIGVDCKRKSNTKIIAPVLVRLFKPDNIAHLNYLHNKFTMDEISHMNEIGIETLRLIRELEI